MTPSISPCFCCCCCFPGFLRIGFFHPFFRKDGQSSDGLTEMNPGVQKNFRWKVPVDGVGHAVVMRAPYISLFAVKGVRDRQKTRLFFFLGGGGPPIFFHQKSRLVK